MVAVFKVCAAHTGWTTRLAVSWMGSKDANGRSRKNSRESLRRWWTRVVTGTSSSHGPFERLRGGLQKAFALAVSRFCLVDCFSSINLLWA